MEENGTAVLDLAVAPEDQAVAEAIDVEAPLDIVVKDAEPEERMLSIALIEVNRDFQARVKVLNDDYIDGTLREVVKKGGKFAGPAATVFHYTEVIPPKKEGGRETKEDHHILADGFNRLEAYKREGKSRFPCIVREGGPDEALAYALKANATHGLPRTTADKERAVRLCLENEKLGEGSNKQIAKRCVVSEGLVARVRKEWEAENKDRARSTRVGADGRTRKSSLAGNPAKKAAKEIVNAATKIASSKSAEKIPAVPQAGKVKAKGLVDGVGREVPEILAHVWASVTQIDGLIHLLKNIEAQSVALRNTGALVYGPASIESNIKAAISDLEHSKPYVVCRGCEGEGCKDCKVKDVAVGFLSVGEWIRLSKEEKVAFGKAAQEAEEAEEVAETE